jgi:hypothetical protein
VRGDSWRAISYTLDELQLLIPAMDADERWRHMPSAAHEPGMSAQATQPGRDATRLDAFLLIIGEMIDKNVRDW